MKKINGLPGIAFVLHGKNANWNKKREMLGKIITSILEVPGNSIIGFAKNQRYPHIFGVLLTPSMNEKVRRLIRGKKINTTGLEVVSFICPLTDSATEALEAAMENIGSIQRNLTRTIKTPPRKPRRRATEKTEEPTAAAASAPEVYGPPAPATPTEAAAENPPGQPELQSAATAAGDPTTAPAPQGNEDAPDTATLPAPVAAELAPAPVVAVATSGEAPAAGTGEDPKKPAVAA